MVYLAIIPTTGMIEAKGVHVEDKIVPGIDRVGGMALQVLVRQVRQWMHVVKCLGVPEEKMN
jgi:hypothetical protein